jgi:GPH family glycoside/pentoside/hexuronide:cation symporter
MPAGAVLHAILIGVSTLGGAMLTCCLVPFQSMTADAADEHEALFGARREGLFFAGLSFAGKASGGVGALIAGVSLDLIGFPTDIAAHGGEAIVIAPHTLVGLGLIHGLIAGGGTLVAAALLIRYRLDKRAHAAVLYELHHRHDGSEVSGH